MKSLPPTALALALFLGCGASPDAAPNREQASDEPSMAKSLLQLPDRDLDRFDERWHARVNELEAEIEASLNAEPMDPGRVGDAFGALGQHYMAHHLVDMATVCFDYAQTVDPEEVRWPYLNGFLHQIQDEFTAAAQDYRTALGIDPDHLESSLRLASVWVELGENEKAETLLDAQLEKHPDQPAALYELGRLRLDQGQLEDAATLLERVVEAQPRAGVARYALGQAYRRLGKTDAARAALELADEQPVVFPDPLLGELAELGVTSEFYRMRAERAMADGDVAAAAGHFGKAIALGEGDYGMRMAHAFALHQSGDRDGAVEQLRTVVALDDPSVTPEQRGEAHHRLGLLLTETGDAAAALEQQRAALVANPSHVGARLALGDAAALAGRFDEAIERYSSVLAEDAHGDHRQALIKRGSAYLNTKNFTAGLADLRRARQLDPDDLEHQLRWLEALEHAGSEEEARRAAGELAKRLAESPPEARRNLTVTLTRLGHKLRRYGALAAAEIAYRKALEPVPETPDLRMNLADLLLVVGNPDEARTLYEAVIATQPDHGDALLGLVRAMVSQGRWAEARTRLESGLQASQSGRLLHLLARVLVVAPAPTADPARGLELAEQVFNARRTPEHAATLAMALAANGRYGEAVSWQEQLILDTAGLGEPWRRWLQGQLTAYRQQAPWRPDPPAETFSPPG